MCEEKDWGRLNQSIELCHKKKSSLMPDRYTWEVALASPAVLQYLADLKLSAGSSLPDQAFGVDNGPPG